MAKQRSPRHVTGDPASSRQAPSAKNHNNTDEIDNRRRWERHWSRIPVDGWRIALATAAVDNIDRRVPGPLSISFPEARAMAAIHGVSCACHPAPARPSIRQSRGAA